MHKEKKSDADDITITNKNIWRDSHKIMEKYPWTDVIKITDKELTDDQMFNDDRMPLDETDNIVQPKILKIFNDDLMTVTNAICELGLRPLVVCESNENYPLEFAKNGGVGEESDLLRFSNLAMCITDTNYPIRELDMLYTPQVCVFKTWNNKRLTKIHKIGVLMVTPIRRPILMSIKTNDGMRESYSNKTDGERMRKRILNAFKICVKYQYKSVVITCLGGKTENPVNEIVKFFNEALQLYPVKYVFLSVKTTDESRDKVYEYFHRHIKRPA